MQDSSFEILLYLDYRSIINSCKAYPHYFRICKMPYFWEKKALLDFNISKEAFRTIAERDNKARYEYLMNTSPKKGLLEESKNGNIDLVKYFIAQGANNYNYSAGFAAKHGHIDIIEFMISQDLTDDYNWIMDNAARGGHINIVRMMLSLGAGDYRSAIKSAAENGHDDIVDLIESYIN